MWKGRGVGMKTTKESLLEYIQREVFTDSIHKEGLSTNEIADAFQIQRSNVSSLLNTLVKEGKLEKTTGRPVLYRIPEKNEMEEICYGDKIFIGAKGSLANAFQVAKAAILYPKRSLNVLISAKPGCGTTHFVYSMYAFAKEKKIFTSSAPFIKINCRHYQKNINELDAEIFGRGVDNSISLEHTLFYKAKGGMLFIDGAELLNAKQISFLSSFIESGIIYSEDRKSSVDCKDVFLVLSCNPSALYQFNQRIPMVIELPELQNRPLKERLELIKYFFSVEANNAKRNIEITQEVMQGLLLADFPRNIKELEMEIRKACATACVRVIEDVNSSIEVCLHDFSSVVQKSLIKVRTRGQEIFALLGTQKLFIFDCNMDYKNLTSHETRDLYKDIQLQYDELSKRGINSSGIKDVINNHISNLFKRYKCFDGLEDTYDIEQLSKTVDPKLINAVQKILNTCQDELNRSFKPSVFYGLCLHINSLLTLKPDKKRIDNDKVIQIIQDYPREYAASVQLAKVLEDSFHLKLSIEEVVILAMFLIEDEEEENRCHPVLLYILHGHGVAKALQEVTKNLIHCENVYSYDLALEKDTRQALEEIRSVILQIDNGQGVIVIYDMGSIQSMLDTIAQEENVKIRYIHVPITLIGIDVARKCLQEEDIDYVYHTTNLELQKMFGEQEKRKEVIVTLCHTGDGGAYQLKQYIEQYSNLGMKVIALSISNRSELIKQIMTIKNLYQIHCFVGTYDPKLLGIPFISISKVFENKTEDLDRILLFEPIKSKDGINYTEVYQFLEEQLHYVSISKLKSVLPQIIDDLEVMYSLDSDQKTGLFVHIACMLDKILEGQKFEITKEDERINMVYQEDFKIISKIMKELEKKFHIIIDDTQIATIIRILKRI